VILRVVEEFMEQGGREDNRQIGALRHGDPTGVRGDTADVQEVVARLSADSALGGDRLQLV
jgi:hypothetical protein